MAFGVFIHRSDSIYDDSPADRYQFPSQYLSRVQQCIGDWIIYYEPRKVTDTRGYFAVAKVQRVIPDPGAPGMHLAMIEAGSYLDFANYVPFSGRGGVIERGGRAGRGFAGGPFASPQDAAQDVGARGRGRQSRRQGSQREQEQADDPRAHRVSPSW
jgi:putative restriction endonuclease